MKHALLAVCLVACRLSVSSTQTTPVADAVVTKGSGDVCKGQIGHLELEGGNPALGYENRKVLVPSAVLRSATAEITAIADWNPNGDQGKLVVSYDTTGQPSGVYSLVLTPVNGGPPIELSDVLRVVDAPKIDSVLDAAVCALNGQAQTVTFRGSGLQNGTVELIAPAASTPLVPTNVRINAAGTELAVELGAQLQKGGPYKAIIRNPGGCELTAPGAGIIVSALPNITAVTAGPKLPTLDADGIPKASNAVAGGARVTVRLD